MPKNTRIDMPKKKEASRLHRRTRILHIAYSPILLFTRNLMLMRQGYSVVSVLGNDQAFGLAAKADRKFDVILIGHCTELSVRREAARFFKNNFPSIRVVALLSDDSVGEVEEADCNTHSESPDEWLDVVRKLVA